MIIWGGRIGQFGGEITDGWRLDPARSAQSPMHGWTRMTSTSDPVSRADHTAVWSPERQEMIIWGGRLGSGALTAGAAYRPDRDEWRSLPSTGDPTARYDHTAVWTGREMIVWGGEVSPGGVLTAGAAYDPFQGTTGAWRTIASSGEPLARTLHTAIWTGAEMVVWGGTGGFGIMTDGRRYVPAYDLSETPESWQPMQSCREPTSRYRHTAVWTGDAMIVWGGYDNTFNLNDGNRYAGCSNRLWFRDSDGDGFGDPSDRRETCTQPPGYVALGGDLVDVDATRYPGAPERCNSLDDNFDGNVDEGLDFVTYFRDADSDGYGESAQSTATCDGSPPVGFTTTDGDCNDANATIHPGALDANCNGVDENCANGADEAYVPLEVTCGTGACYLAGTTLCIDGVESDSCAGDRWSPMSTVNAPSARDWHTAVWTGTEMIVWGGESPSGAFLSDGGRYNPTTDSWTALPSAGAPTARVYHGAAWAAGRMVIWGGYVGSNSDTQTGSRYDPDSDSWEPTTTAGAPSARSSFSAVSTGSLMLIWSGFNDTTSGYLADGAAYDPVANSWTAMSATNAPAPRTAHRAVWTGSHMLVWGGGLLNDRYYTDVGRFDPATNQWSPSSATGSPPGRESFTAVWAGDRMIVWGGYIRPVPGPAGYRHDGGQYDPATDTWAATSVVGAPTARAHHEAQWTGQEMLVWGGCCDWNDGKRYDPRSDRWTAITAPDAPAARRMAASVWTGREFLVWGGLDEFGVPTDSGGRYCTCMNPVTYFRDLDGDGYGDRSTRTTACDGTILPGYVANALDCDDGSAAINPSAPEDCNSVDDDCDGGVDEGIAAPTGRPNLTVRKVASSYELAWSVVPESGSYDVVRGDIGELLASGGNFTASTTACVADDEPGTSVLDPSVPVSGGGLWQLVRPANCVGIGTYDEEASHQQGSRDAEIQAAPSACP
ncbi:hypothetical protein DF3PB_4010004 [uncultured Defluviicoccus sp.]|uniref:Attractin/MKLN-like beta-propeller domain-containing protein n=1 Tax=metagenome TaxID=256318 RepID=A0A380TFQ7_9ZZZZ|nr:hypothetical protein DF3PB_4010004 [uncultured Defluviicoccus sp.]